jgi:hypothetical protein
MRRRVTGAGFEYASEVYLGEGYVADAVVIGSLQHRFWLEVTLSDIEEYRSLGDVDRVIPPEKQVMVFETKVSRQDFMCTFNGSKEGNRRKPAGNLHYLITPEGLKCEDHLPEWWGILIQARKGLRQIKQATYIATAEAELWHAGFRVLLAQHRNPRCLTCLRQVQET